MWKDGHRLAIKIIDDKKGYWAEDRLTRENAARLAFHVYKNIHGLPMHGGTTIYLGLSSPVAITKNMIIFREGLFIHFRITDFKRNYWAETKLCNDDACKCVIPVLRYINISLEELAKMDAFNSKNFR